MTGLETAIGTTQKPSYWQVLKNRNFTWLWAAYIVSLLGDALHNVAIMALIWQETGDLALMGVVYAVAQAPTIVLGLLAGILADRWNRKTTMIVCDVLRGLVVMAIPLLAGARLGWVFALLAMRATLTSLWLPVVMAVIPDIVSEGDLVIANSLWRGADLVSRVLGYAVGGVIVSGIGPSLSFCLDGLSYLFSSGMILFVTVPPLQRVAQGWSVLSIWRDLVEGVSFLCSSRVVLSFTILFLLLTLPIGMYNSLLPVFAFETLDIGSDGFGALEAAMALGGVLGACLLGLFARGSRGKMIFVGILVEMTCYAALVVTRNYWLVLALLFISGIDEPLLLVPFGTIFQEHTPSPLRGRVFTVRSTLFAGIMMVSMGIGPWLSSVLGLYAQFGVLALALLTIFVGAILSPTIRKSA
jgi:MFS family permease